MRCSSQGRVRQCWVYSARATAKPSGNRTENECQGSEQGAARDRLGGRVGGLGGLLPGLADRLLVLLLILLDLRTSLVFWDILCTSQCLCRALAGSLCLSLISSERCPDRGCRRISQHRRVIAARRGPDLRLDGTERIRSL